MEIPVSEQMRILKMKIKKFRDMLSNPGLVELDFDDDENENYPKCNRFNINKYEKVNKNNRSMSKQSRFDNIIQNAPQFEKKTSKITNKIINNSRGYHYSINQTKQKPAKVNKPILFLKDESISSSSSYYSDEDEEEENLYSSSDAAEYESSVQEEEEDESEDASESFSIITKVLKGKKKDKNESKNTNTTSSVISGEEEPNGSLVNKLIINVENGFSPSTSKLSTTEDVIIVEKPVTVVEEALQSEEPSNDTKEFDRILAQISRQNFDMSTDDEDNYSLNDIDLKKNINATDDEDDIQSFLPLLKQTKKFREGELKGTSFLGKQIVGDSFSLSSEKSDESK